MISVIIHKLNDLLKKDVHDSGRNGEMFQMIF